MIRVPLSVLAAIGSALDTVVDNTRHGNPTPQQSVTAHIAAIEARAKFRVYLLHQCPMVEIEPYCDTAPATPPSEPANVDAAGTFQG